MCKKSSTIQFLFATPVVQNATSKLRNNDVTTATVQLLRRRDANIAYTLGWLRMSAIEWRAFINASSLQTSSWRIQFIILATIVDGGTWGFPKIFQSIIQLHIKCNFIQIYGVREYSLAIMFIDRVMLKVQSSWSKDYIYIAHILLILYKFCIVAKIESVVKW